MIAPPLSRKSSYYNRVMVLYTSKVRNWGDSVSRMASGKHPGSRVCMPSPGLQAWQVVLIHNRWGEWMNEYMQTIRCWAGSDSVRGSCQPSLLWAKKGRSHPLSRGHWVTPAKVVCEPATPTWLTASLSRNVVLSSTTRPKISQWGSHSHCAQVSQIPLWVTSSPVVGYKRRCWSCSVTYVTWHPQSLVASLLKLSPAKTFLSSLQSSVRAL